MNPHRVDDRRGVREQRPKKQAVFLIVSVVFLFQLTVVLWLTSVVAHEPITTKIRFNKEVIRVLERNCLGCHRPGGIAMSLATYEEARPWAKAIKEEMLEKRMPPWHAVKGYGEFRNAPLLTQREIDMVVNWVEGGAPKGEDKDLPARPLFSDDWQRSSPDLVLELATNPNINSETDEHLWFSAPTNLKEDRWITAIDLKPGNRSVVHCATIYLGASGKQKAGAGKLRGVKSAMPPAHGAVLATWMPGQRAVALPEGTGQLMPAGSRIVVRIHYRGSGEPAKDQSAVGLYFTTATPRKQVQEAAITNPGAIIPAGAALHQLKAEFTTSADLEAVAIRPRAHPLIASLQATAYRPDGTEEVLIWARGYRFDWQPTYYFKQPISLPKGTRIEVIAYFDNTEGNADNPDSPPKQLRWSDLTADPLCALLMATTRAGNE